MECSEYFPLQKSDAAQNKKRKRRTEEGRQQRERKEMKSRSKEEEGKIFVAKDLHKILLLIFENRRDLTYVR